MLYYIEIIKVILASALGAIIGIERKGKRLGIGTRTASLITLSSCLFTISALKFSDPTNIARVIQGLAAGIGFIGAAIIWRQRQEENKHFVSGLTTAVTVWFLVALGIFVAAEYYLESVIITFLVLIVLLLRRINID